VEHVDAYVTRLGRVLRGPRGARTDLLTEVRDSLVDATEAYARAGYPREAAAGRAVADFGEIAEIAGEYQTELGMLQARRTAVGILIAVGGQPLFWNYIRPLLGTEDPADATGPMFTVVDALTEWCGTATLVAAVLLVLGSRSGGPRIARGAGVLAMAAGVLFTALGSAMSLLGPDPTTLADVLWLVLPLATPMLLLVRAGRRCLLFS
jgi:hypothetical protein